MEKINYIFGYEKLKIFQDDESFNFSLDSLLLANFVNVRKNKNKTLDIGTGNAIIPIILSQRGCNEIIGVELQKKIYDLACKSVQYNKLESVIQLVNSDINIVYNDYPTDCFDLITCNPPFFKINNNSKLNDSSYKSIARHEKYLNLDQLFSISRKLLKNNGSLYIVHRPERISEIIVNMKKKNFELKRIKFIYPHINSDANMVLIEARKNGNIGLKVENPLYVHNDDGSYTDQLKEYLS